ncbi:MAG: Uma2 family endonuclease, partial [Acidobacteriota bacterium]|nr:Uma2 family endonuclease [Acidobacteriota bacterium]
MSAVITQESAIAENRTLDLYRLRVEDYDKMIEYGIFGDNERVELLDGVLVKMSPKGVRHRTATTKTTNFFYEYLRQRAVIQVQDPIRLDDFSEPEPDIV